MAKLTMAWYLLESVQVFVFSAGELQIIGSNYFLDTKILIDGPRNRILLSQAELGQVTLEKPPTIYELAGQWLESFVDWLADWFP